MRRILSALAALACFAVPVFMPLGWGPLWAIWPGALFATYALLAR